MSNKLTKEDFINGWVGISWEVLQAHTAECVAEATAGMIRIPYDWAGHPWASYIKIAYCTVDIPKTNDRCGDVILIIDRPAPRLLSDDELINVISCGIGGYGPHYRRLSRPTLEAMAHDLGIRTTRN